MLDTIGYKKKPNGREVGIISNRIINHPANITPEELAHQLIKGKTFTPGYFNKKVNGKIRRRIENWTSQQILCLDFDDGTMTIKEALDEFKDTAMFIYTSFSHTENHHRFRVVFATEEVMNNYNDMTNTLLYLMNDYPVDEQCKDGSRLFYGGNDLYVINYNNRIPIKRDNNRINKNLSIGNLQSRVLGTPTYINNLVGVPKRVDMIRNVDFKGINEAIGNNKPITFYTRTEAVEYINNYNMSEFLGINDPKKFSCIFHEDESPSANIFLKKDKDGSSVMIYKCFSECCEFRVGTLRKVVEYIQKSNKTKAFNFLLKCFNINIAETEDQKEQRAELQKNIELLIDGTLKNDHEALYERIKPYIKDLIVLHTIAKENLPPKHYTEDQVEFLVYCSMRHIANAIGLKDHKRIMKTLSLFVYLGLVFKKERDNVPIEFLEDVERAIGKKNAKHISFFGIPKYEESRHFEFGEKKAIEFKENNMNMKSFGYEMLLRTVGYSEANRVYPKRKQRELTEQQRELSSLFEKVIMKQIKEKGWTTNNLIKEDIQSTEGFRENNLKMIIGEVVSKYDLDVVQLNKKIKEEYKIGINGYPKIICKNGFIK